MTAVIDLTDEIVRALAAPFPAADIEWRIGRAGLKDEKIDSRPSSEDTRFWGEKHPETTLVATKLPCGANGIRTRVSVTTALLAV